jgi:tetratricopeptide (TPR) repeat protein
MLLAKLYYSAGDYEGAVREYEALLRDGSEDPVLLENLALALWKEGRDYTDVLSRLRGLGASGAFLADYAEGRISYEAKNYAGALAPLLRAAGAAPASGSFSDQPALFWMTADSAYRGKDEDAAYGWLGELLKISPEHEEGKRLLAKIEKARAAAAKAAQKAAAAAAKKKK